MPRTNELLTFRYGGKEDTQQIIDDLALPLATQTAKTTGLQVDIDGITDFVTRFCDNENNKPLLAVIGKNQVIAGALFLYKKKIFWLKDPILMDHGMFVREEYRNRSLKGKNIALKLTQWAVSTARANGCMYLPSNSTGTPQADHLYFKSGFKYLGGNWMMK